MRSLSVSVDVSSFRMLLLLPPLLLQLLLGAHSRCHSARAHKRGSFAVRAKELLEQSRSNLELCVLCVLCVTPCYGYGCFYLY